MITFKSTKILQTGPNSYEVDGDDTGCFKPEKLTLAICGKGTCSREIKGAVVFNCKDSGMNNGNPFIKIADHVDAIFPLKGKRVSGPLLSFSR